MPAQDSYRAGIYRMKIRKQPPSVYLLAVAIVMLAVGSVLALALTVVKPLPIEQEVQRQLRLSFSNSVLLPFFVADAILPLAAMVSVVVIAGALSLRRWADAGFFVLTMLIGAVILDYFRPLFIRPGLTPDITQGTHPANSLEFLNLSVMLAVVCAVQLGYMTVRAYRVRALNEARDRVVLMIMLLAAVLLVGVSSLGALTAGRIWPLDMLDSYLFGSTYAIVAVLLRRRWMAWRGTDTL